jgi:hypothetical protein
MAGFGDRENDTKRERESAPRPRCITITIYLSFWSTTLIIAGQSSHIAGRDLSGEGAWGEGGGEGTRMEVV